MEKKNKIIISVTILIVVLLIVGVSTYRVICKHNEKLREVDSKYIIEAAKRCVNEHSCSGNIITLKNLYDII